MKTIKEMVKVFMSGKLIGETKLNPYFDAVREWAVISGELNEALNQALPESRNLVSIAETTQERYFIFMSTSVIELTEKGIIIHDSATGAFYKHLLNNKVYLASVPTQVYTLLFNIDAWSK